MTLGKTRVATFALIACLALFGIVVGFAFPSDALAWANCPKGLVNDPFPGRCSRYVDTNGDDICDLSQSEPTAATTRTTAAQKLSTSTTSLAVTTTTSGEPPTGDCPLGPCAGCGACLSIGAVTTATSTETASAVGVAALAVTGSSATTSTSTPTSGGSGATDDGATGDSSSIASATASEAVVSGTVTAADSESPSLFTHYNVSPIAIGFLLVYSVSFVLYKTKRIKTTTHRKIWNVLLLATFLITGIFGLILVVQLDYELPFTMPINLLFWHVEAGVVMTFISLFHLGWHFNYYRNLLKTGRKRVRAAREEERAQTADEPQVVWQAREQRNQTEQEAREERRARREARRAEREARHSATRSRPEFEADL